MLPEHISPIHPGEDRRRGSSDVNKDLGLKAKAKAKDLCHKAKAKDLGLKAKAKDPKYQGHIFHQSSSYSAHHFFIVSVVCVSMFAYYFTCDNYILSVYE